MPDTHQTLLCFARANEFKEGDLIVGGTRDDQLRSDARRELAEFTLGEIGKTAFVDDAVTEALHRSLDRTVAADIANLTLADLKRILVSDGCPAWLQEHNRGLSSEAIAGVVKLMANFELGSVARRVFNPLPGPGVAIGSQTHFGSRIQPNSPGDDDQEILLSILEGLTFGCGDVIIGLNPASDDVDTIARLEELLASVVQRLELPTRYCVLSDIVKQTTVRNLTRVDVGFQSLAGTSRALVGMAGLDVDGVLDMARGFDGLYFETGQGSAVTNGVAEGVDMVTLESRAYGVARLIQRETGSWMIVNDVAGFIGPEVFKEPDQLLRACLEDTVMAKLHGITMGLDVCSTFHMGIDPATLKSLTEAIVKQAAPAYLMAVAGNADPMLGYMTTSFREHPKLKSAAGKQMSSAMARRLDELGVSGANGNGEAVAQLYARFVKAGGDSRSTEALAEEGKKKLHDIAARGFDLGYGTEPDGAAPPQVDTRIDSIYRNARNALYSRIEHSVLRASCQNYVVVQTPAADREQFLSDPSSGELLPDRCTATVASLYPSRRPQIQIVISDGLNANAVNLNLPKVLPRLRKELTRSGFFVGQTDIVVENARVRAGYHCGLILGVDAIINLIGERPGTGLDTLSAYVTYGRDKTGVPRWSPQMDHSLTNAICGIHERGKQPQAAAAEIVNLCSRIFETGISGVELNSLRRKR